MAGGINPPASVIESWPSANYVDPPTRGHGVLVMIIVLGSLALVAVVARFWSRFRLQRNAGLDDWLFLAAIPLVVAFAITSALLTTVYGLDKHLWDLRPTILAPMRKFLLAYCIFYIFATCLIKLSILSFYRRLTDRTISAKFMYTVWTCMAIQCSQIVVCLATLCFSCRPLAAYWHRFDPTWISTHSYTCNPQGPTLFAMSLISVTQDFVATVLPFTLFLRIQIPRRQKIALSCTFAGGLVVCAVGAYRSYTIHRTYFQTYDSTWSSYDFVGASAAEILLAAIFASAPALKYYVRNFIDNTTDKKDRSYSSADPLVSNFSDATTLTSPIKTHFGLEANEMDFWSVIDPFEAGVKASIAMANQDCNENMTIWHARTASAQEQQLLDDGILNADVSFGFFDKKTKRMVTNDPHPMKYPWVED